MRLMTVVVVILVVLPGPCATLAGQDARRDGNWWQEQSDVMKVCYMVGFFDGMELGHKFSYWKNVKEDPSAVGKSVDSYNHYSNKYLSNVTNGQLVDGLDAFFKDYRNRGIRVDDAVWLVVNSIAGTPQEELNRMIESWRKNVK